MMMIKTEPDLTKYSKIINSTATIMTELCSKKNSKRKKTTKGQKKPMWKEKIKKEIEYMLDQLSILTNLQRGVNVRSQLLISK